MKKKIFLILILIMITTLVSCKKETKKGCEHTFQEATCTQAKTCSKCGATEGEALGHTFQKATCQAPKTCSRCGATEGAAIQHNYVLNAQGNYFCTICKKHIVDILGKNYFLNKFSEMDGYQYERVNFCSFGDQSIPVLDNFARYKLLKEQAVFDEEKQTYLVPIIIEKVYALDKDKGDIEYVVQSAKPGNSGSKKMN